jgi:hypothetical protein
MVTPIIALIINDFNVHTVGVFTKCKIEARTLSRNPACGGVGDNTKHGGKCSAFPRS